MRPPESGRGSGAKALSAAASMLVGGSFIDDANRLRSGSAEGVLPFAVSAPSTLGTWLRSFTWGHVRQLDRAHELALSRAWSARERKVERRFGPVGGQNGYGVTVAEIHGSCEVGFEGVRDAFSTNFDEGDLGASCAVVHRGELVVDLWGGHRDVAATKPWERDTIVNVWSTTKMMAALCMLVLHDRGALSVDDPVAAHWPEFAAAGKEAVLIRHLMSHTAGLAGFDPPITEEQMYDWDHCCANLAAQTPWWEPGTASGYHASTQGWLLGEVVRRVAGRTLGAFFREEIAEPLGADFHIGLADSEFDRVAEMRTDEADEIGDGKQPIPARRARGEAEHSQFVNTDRWRRAEFPASNGHGNARSVAEVVSILAQGGESQGIRFLGPSTIERIFEVQASGPDLVLGYNTKFGIGYGLNSKAMPLGINDRTLFWAGWGGSMAVVDVENSLTVCYAMNRMMSDVVGGMRAGRVIFAAHDAGTALRA